MNKEPIWDWIHVAEFRLPANYPVDPPEVTILTPVWHPNINMPAERGNEQKKMLVFVEGMRSQAEVRAKIRELQQDTEWLKSMLSRQICLDVLSWNWRPDVSMVDIVVAVGETIQYKLYTLGKDFNPPVDEWAKQILRKQPDIFPTDSHNLGKSQLVSADTDIKVRPKANTVRVVTTDETKPKESE